MEAPLYPQFLLACDFLSDLFNKRFGEFYRLASFLFRYQPGDFINYTVTFPAHLVKQGNFFRIFGPQPLLNELYDRCMLYTASRSISFMKD